MPAIVVPVATWVAGVVSVAGAAIGITGAASGWLVATVYTVTEAALYAGMSYAIDAVTRPSVKPSGSELKMNIDPAYPREMIIGQRPVGGSVVARYSRDVNNYFAHVVIQVADHPCVELSKVYDGGRLVQDSPLVHGVRTEITAYSNSGGPRLWMTWHDGRPGQEADADLVTKSATDPEVVSGAIDAWTSDHKGAGCAYVHVEMRWDPDILTSMPEFTFLTKGARLYDRRLDTTAGGSGAHRLDDPSTWEYSTNAMVALDHYLLGYKVENDPLAFGIGLSAVEVPYDQFAAAADLCDEDVETGTDATIEIIKRYAANGVITAADYFEEVIESFQVQMAARVVDLGGRIGVLGAEERAITVSLTEDDLISGEPLQFSDKLAFADLIGSVTGTFADPANNYEPTPFTPLYTQYQALPDGGEAQAVTLALPFEVHPRRADRLVSAWAARETLQPRLAAVFSPKAWKLEAGDWFEFTSPRLQITNAKFEVVDIVKNDDFTVIITARAIDPDFLAFDNDNDPDLSVPAAVAPLSLFLDVPEFDVEVTTLTAGGVVEPALEVTLTSNETVAREIVYEYAIWDAGADPGDEVVGPSLVDSAHVSQVVTKLRKGILPDSVYAVRAKAKAGLRESPWTDWSDPITTGSTYAVGSASSVPWSGVTGSGKPSDNADVTSANTAAAITSQGALATLSQVNLGVSGKVFRDDGTTRVTDAIAITSLGTASAIAGQGSFATLSSINSTLADSNNLLRKTSGGLFTGELAADVTSTHTAASITSQGALATLGQVNLGASGRVYRDDGTTRLTDAIAVTSLGTASAIASQGALATLSQVAVGASGKVYRDDGVTHLTDALAVTSLGTAAAIAGQGALATKATIDSSSLMGAGVVVYTALASTAVRLGTNITRNDGSTSLTDALAVTSLGTAAAIASQGDLATTNKATLPFGVNVLANSDFLNGSSYPPLGWTSGIGSITGISATRSIVTAGARRAVKVELTGTTTGGTYFDALYSPVSSLALVQRWLLPVVAGDVVGASVLVAKNSAVSSVYANVFFYDAAGAYLTEVVAGSSVTANANGDTGNPTDYALCSGVATAPTNARFAMLLVRGLASTGAVNPTVWTMSPMLCRLPAGQTAVPPYSPGPPDRLADQTSANVAASITGQGWGATASEAAARATRGRGLLKNATFEEYFTGTAVPPQWSNWANGTGTQVAKPFGDGNCFQIAGGAGANAGFMQDSAGVQASTNYLLAATVRRQSGTLAAAGVYVEFYDASNALLGNAQLRLATEATTAGLINASPDGNHRWEKLITTPATTSWIRVYAMTHWSSYGSTAVANSLVWLECDIVPMSLVAQLRADVTASNTASAIAGQGPWAVLADTVDSIRKPNANLLYNSTGADALNNWLSTTNWYAADSATLGRYIGTSLNGTRTIQSDKFICVAASPVRVSLNVGGAGITSGAVTVQWYTSGLTYLSGQDSSVATIVTGVAYPRYSATVTPPATAAYGRVSVGGTVSSGFLIFYKVKVENGSTETSWIDDQTLTKLGPIEAGANVTETRVAASITSQGALATLGQVNLGASGKVYRDDGTTRLTDALAVTALGTASAISGQGLLATAGAQRGTSYSGTPTEGSIWTDTSVTPNAVKFYTGGAWVIIAYTVQPLGLTFSPGNVNTTHTTNVHLNLTLTATVTGGSGSFSYFWTINTPITGATPTLSARNVAAPTFDCAHTAAGTIDGTLDLMVIDNVTGQSIVRKWGYYSEGTGGGSGGGGGGGLPP